MKLSSCKKISEVIREYLQFLKICGVFVGFSYESKSVLNSLGE